MLLKKKIVAIIPIKTNSKRVKGKNFIKIMRKPLYRLLLDKLKKTNFDEVYIDTDSPEIEKYALRMGYKFIKRLPRLSRENANGNDLLNYHSKIIKADIYFQLFVTAPLLSIKTINNCIKKLENSKNYDSILTSREIYSWFWFKKKAINYNPKTLPRSQDANPIIQETTGLYGIKRKALIRLKCRIGKNPFFYNINERESIDLDTDYDFKILRMYLKK